MTSCKVVIVALNYPPSIGGAQEHVRRIAEGLVAAGHEVTVLTTDAVRSHRSSDPGRIQPPSEVLGGVQVRRYPAQGAVPALHQAALRLRTWLRRRARSLRRRPLPSPGPASVGPVSPSLLAAIARAGRDADVLIGCQAPATTFAVPALAPRRRAALILMPLIHHGPQPPAPSIGRSLARADAVVTSTRFEAGLVGELGARVDAVRILPPGTEVREEPEIPAPDARARLGLPERPTVGYIGRIAAYKGVDTLLEAAPRIWASRPDTTVLLAGAATGWQGYLDAVAAQGDDGRLVHLAGFAEDDRRLLLAACDVVVFASREESFGMVIAEAWAARRPVVVADIPVSVEVVGDGGGGVVVPASDPVALADAVLDLLGDPERAAALGRAGRAAAEQRHGWAPMVAGWQALVAELGADRSGGGR